MNGEYTGSLTRGQKLWNRLRDRRDTEPMSIERAKIVTASYKETEGYPIFRRRSAALKSILTEIPIYIDDDQLLAGDFGTRPMCAEWHPEFTVEWVHDELKKGVYPDGVGEDDVKEMFKICEYWKDKSAKETFYKYWGDENVEMIGLYNEHGSNIFNASMEAQTEKGWLIANYEKVIKVGFRAMINEMDEELSGLKIYDDKDMRKENLLMAMKECLEGVILYAHRYADLAEKLAGQESNPERRKELLTIRDNCRSVPEFPARSFHEAVQCMWFCHVAEFWDTRGVGISFGRVDQYLWPYYSGDTANGTLDKEFATQILECFRIKLSAMRYFAVSYIRAQTSGETQFHNCTLGGITREGHDAVNDLSFLWLDAAERVQSPHPTLSIRWHERIDQRFIMRGMEIVKLGVGYPAWFNDRSSIEYLLSNGIPLDEARDYGIAGCVLSVPQHTTGITIPAGMITPKILEITLNNGIDPVNGNKVGLELGSLTDFETFDDLFDAFNRQLANFIKVSSNYSTRVRIHRSDTCPDVYLSTLVDDCMKNGRTVTEDGARHQQMTHYVVPVGVVDTCDSMMAIKKCVFEDKTLGKQEMLDLLKTNFEGREDTRQMLQRLPKYGNDIDEADQMVADFYDRITRVVKSLPGGYGSKFQLAPHNMSAHVFGGTTVGALPNGRPAGESLSDGAVSCVHGADKNGPAALMRSAGKVDHTPIFGTLFNMKFLPSSLEKAEDRRKVLGLVRSFFSDYNGRHIQFNIIDREKLLEARAHPEEYRNLVVRVAGYSALWVELSTQTQDDIIARTEHNI